MKFTKVLVLLLVLGLIAAACAGDADETTTTAAPTDTTAATTTTEATTTTTVVSLTLSEDGLGDGLSFGADGDAVATVLTSVFGPPTDASQLELVPLVNPTPGFTWGDADDGLGLLSKFPFMRFTCWAFLCLTDTSSDGNEWLFSGWEQEATGRNDLGLSTSAGLEVGDTYGRLLDLYPGATISGGEGGSVGFQLPGWPLVADGAVVGNGRLGISLSPPFDPDLVPADTPIQSIFSSDGSTSYGCC